MPAYADHAGEFRKTRHNKYIIRTYAIGVIPVKLVLAKAGNGNPGR